MSKKRVFSGVQPSGSLHIGNYIGAIRNWVEDQDQFENIFCVVDQHAITVDYDPDELRANTREVVGLYLACGLDPDKSTLLVQSHIPEHTELAWLLNCLTPMGWLERMTQFKEKSGDQRERVSAGLFTYPALMAADILLYQAQIVPVGEDQAQHLELTRDIAQRFNTVYGETFVVPETKLPAVGARVLGRDDPTQKMSKSTPGSGHAVGLLDPPSRIRKTIARAVTDSKSGVDFDDLGPGVANLLNIFQAFHGWTNEQIKSHFADMRYGDLKKQVAEAVVSHLEPIQQKYNELTSDRGAIREILRGGAERVAPLAESTMTLVRGKTGLYRG